MNIERQPRFQTCWRSCVLAISLVMGGSPATTALAQQHSDTNVRGTVGFPYRHTGVQLMRTFRFEYGTFNRPLASMAVWTDTPFFGDAIVTFQDNNADDPYSFSVAHADVDPSGIFVGTLGQRNCRDHCTFDIENPIGDFVFVLRGFRLRYANGNHNNVHHIGIYEQNGELTVFFRDGRPNTTNDDFTVDVQYAYVPASRFSVPRGFSSGDAISGGFDARDLPNPAVLRGFDFAFTTSQDRWLEHFEIRLTVAGIFSLLSTIFNEAGTNDDLVNWAVDWGVLN